MASRAAIATRARARCISRPRRARRATGRWIPPPTTRTRRNERVERQVEHPPIAGEMRSIVWLQKRSELRAVRWLVLRRRLPRVSVLCDPPERDLDPPPARSLDQRLAHHGLR